MNRPKHGVQLVFLPFITPQFPEDRGRVEVPLENRQEAIEMFDKLSYENLIEEASIYHADGHVEKLL